MNLNKDLDLAFAMDCTGSMGRHIAQAKEKIRNIVETISRVTRTTVNVRLALVEYRDHPPEDKTFVTRVTDFTNVNGMKRALDRCAADGGGDCPEAVADGLFKVKNLSWRSDSRICVLVTDAPPHGINGGDESFHNGCPDGHDPLRLANDLGEKGITLHILAVEPSVTKWREFYMALAWITGGLYIPLTSAESMPDIIIGSAKEILSLQSIKTRVKQLVKVRMNPVSKEIDAKGVSEELFKEFEREGVRVFQLNFGANALPKITGRAKRYARFDQLSEVRELFRNYSGSDTGSGGRINLEAKEDPVTMFQVQRMVQQALLMCKAEA